MSETMTVRVRDRSKEKPWGSPGPASRPAIRAVTISTTCPICGGPRGEPRNLNQCDDGDFYSVDVWENPCGHRDPYVDVIAEAEAQS